ncbi:Serine/threonine-protein kinase PrkC [Caulifigura coniformis]|uniref:non-specific serine/threonine protein kinase n=1 Tax=Caulifigura coniformis TaxID=2527983 RepID=A0A517SFL5_9PLAN|nr:protein kinase [Caulifigura coniformis]QDT54912.1 Serine/threonine-protein kinase PrkC [Caulifigura coniformis]
MSISPSTCDPRRPLQFLEGALSDADQSAFETHLESCPICRASLESKAGDVQAWSEVREYLSSFGEDADATRDAVQESSEIGDHGITAVLKLLAPTDDPAMVGRLAGYEIVGVIGCGGMGVVLKGFDARLNRFVAIKLLAPHLAASASARRRFAREAKAAAAVVHENVVAIHGVSEFQGLPYLVMPYVKGESLQKRLDRSGPLGVSEVLRIGRQIAAGLAAAHAQGLIHRDVKPANILLEENVDRLQLTDFGLARTVDDASETRTGIIAGTPQYMSPEQARGDALDTRSDLFSVGSVMYTMCAGRPPFRAETPYGILRRITDDTPRPLTEVNPDTPGWLEAIVGKLHSKEPADRFVSCEELAETLEQCLAHVRQPATVGLPEGVTKLVKPARPGSAGISAARFMRLMKTGRGQMTAGILATATLAGVFVMMRQPAAELASESGLPPAGLPESTLPVLDPALDWDRVAGETELLKGQAEELAGRAEQLWDGAKIPSAEMPP